mmetsp:Transcript_90345/g.279478  ORF Transcript_90345/g.279478 Transcript_90345/m.279478 type:complete len:531 (+) Transcript_90345:50-1642(+)
MTFAATSGPALVVAAALCWHSAVGSGGSALPDGLRPAEVWRHFGRIMRIPRCSGQEAAIQSYIRTVADGRGLAVTEDTIGNLIVKRPGSGSGSKAEPVILQGHVDMVCEKNADSLHDWDRDAVKASVRDGWLIADETTLGADNGIGISVMLALLELPRSATLPPLEAIFTVQEETGLDGAHAVDVSGLQGRRMLNFDSEEWGIVYIGCAGGGSLRIHLPVETSALAPPLKAYSLALKGLRGGHSGADIHKCHGNALLLLARAVHELQAILSGVRLLDLDSGNLDNAIPREGVVLVGIDPARLPQAQAAVRGIEADLRAEFGRVDPGLELQLGAEPQEGAGLRPLSEESASQLLDLLDGLPYGVLKMSHEVPGLVETSNNVARVRRVGSSSVEVICLARSSITPALEHTLGRMARTAKRCGATSERGFMFPGWAPNASQALLSLTRSAFAEVTAAAPNVTAIHAGLECGLIGGKIPGVEMVSFGPDIVGAHAPGERVRLSSVEELWVLVGRLMARLAEDAEPGAAGRGVEL